MKVGLCLSGGGANGDYQAGVCYELLKNNVKVDKIASCSVGIANGLLYSLGNAEQLKNEWYGDIQDKVLYKGGFFNELATLFGRSGIYSYKGLLKLFHKYENVDVKVPITFQNLDLQTGTLNTLTAFNSLDSYTIKYMVQGMLMQYAWKSFEDRIDGGNVNPVPYNLLNPREYDKIIIIENYPIIANAVDEWKPKGPAKGLKYLIRASQITSLHRREEQLNKIKYNKKYIIVQPDNMTGDFLDFSIESIDYGFKLGQVKGKKLVNKLKDESIII